MVCNRCGGKMVQLLFSYACANACEKNEAKSERFHFVGYTSLVDDDVERMKGIGKPGTGLHCPVYPSPDECSFFYPTKIYKVLAEREVISESSVNIFYSEDDIEKAGNDFILYYGKSPTGILCEVVKES